MELKIKKLHPAAIIPTYGTPGSACFDLHAVFEPTVDGTYMHEQTDTVIDTGLAFEIPNDHVMLVFSRSGHGFKHNVRLANAVGVVDSDYRGEVRVKLTADIGCNGFEILPGDRIAQAMVIPVQHVQFVEVDELGETKRGTGGFGSTGVR